MVLAGPRVYFAMARDGMFVRAAARVHPRFHTPATAIVAQGVWSSVLVLSGTLAQLVTYTGFAVVLFTGVAVSALFVLRRRDPLEPAAVLGARRTRGRPRSSSSRARSWSGEAMLDGIGLVGGRCRAHRPGRAGVLRDPASAASVRRQVPSLAANSRNDAGEWRRK